jgi:hypothetical protein
VDPAETPRGPISPNVGRELEVSFATGLFFAVAIAFGLEYLDNRIKSPQEMKAQLGVPFLGMVPSVGKDKMNGDPLLSRAVPANFAEAFKSIRTNVLFSSAEDGMRSVVVTSSGPGEGKSIVSANLAVALAQAGQRVLLIDGDMRRPRVHEIFGADQEPGLSNVLTGVAKSGDAIRRCPTIHGLWLLASGHIPPNPAELLGSHRFREFIGRDGQLDCRQPRLGRRVRGRLRQNQPSGGAHRGRTARCRERPHYRVGVESREPDASSVLLLGVLPQGVLEVLREQRELSRPVDGQRTP